MAISDEHVRTIRAYVLDTDEYNRRLARLEQTHDVRGCEELLAGTLFLLVARKFDGSDQPHRDIVRWVARVRARDADRKVDELNPVAAEQMLLQFLGLSSSYLDLDIDTRETTQDIILFSLYNELEFTEHDLDELLAEAREAVEQATAHPKASNDESL